MVATLLVKPFGFYMTRVFNGERTFLSPVLRPVERVIYSLSRVNENEEQGWLEATTLEGGKQAIAQGRWPVKKSSKV